MEEKVDAIIAQMSKSHMELARIISAEKDVVFQMAQLVGAIPDRHDSFANTDIVAENAAGVTKSVISYLNSLADLADAIADNLTHVISKMGPESDE